MRNIRNKIKTVAFLIFMFIYFYFRMYETEDARITPPVDICCVNLPIKCIKNIDFMNGMDKNNNNGPSV